AYRDHAAEGLYHRADAKRLDKDGVDGTDGDADCHRRDHRGDRWQARDEDDAGDDGGGAHHRTDRKIDAANEDNEGHAEAEEENRRGLPQDVLDIAERSEYWRGCGESQEENQRRD